VKLIAELNPHNYPTNPSIDKNLGILFSRLLELQSATGRDFQINSGLRSDDQQLELIREGKSTAVHSKHIAGAAADVNDPDGSLAEYVKANLDYMATIGFWMEDFGHTKGWVHFQIMAPGSGHRVFIP
jgi:uncharacterized protein YcbK (DUF882 family)